MDSSKSDDCHGKCWWVGLSPHPPTQVLPRAVRSEFLDQLSVVLNNEARAGVHRLSTTELVSVEQVQVQQHNGHVALCVLLLIDGECEFTIGNRLHCVAGEVDSADDHVASYSLCCRQRCRSRDVSVQGEDAIDIRVRLESGLDLCLALREVGKTSRELQVLYSALEGVSRAVAALLQTDVVLLLNGAQHRAQTGLVELDA